MERDHRNLGQPACLAANGTCPDRSASIRPICQRILASELRDQFRQCQLRTQHNDGSAWQPGVPRVLTTTAVVRNLRTINPDADTHCGSYAYRDSNSDPDVHRDSNPDADTHPFAYPHRYPDAGRPGCNASG